METHAVLWSGGFDSTSLVHWLASQGHKVKGLYVAMENNERKTIEEIHALGRLSGLFKRDGMDVSWSKVSTVNRHDLEMNVLRGQMVTWLTEASMCLTGNENSLSMGVVCGDDDCSWLTEINALWKSMSAFCFTPLPVLNFPFLKWKKIEVVKRLPKQYRDLCFTCEIDGHGFKLLENRRSCGRCPKCLEIKEVMKEINEFKTNSK